MDLSYNVVSFTAFIVVAIVAVCLGLYARVLNKRNKELTLLLDEKQQTIDYLSSSSAVRSESTKLNSPDGFTGSSSANISIETGSDITVEETPHQPETSPGDEEKDSEEENIDRTTADEDLTSTAENDDTPDEYIDPEEDSKDEDEESPEKEKEGSSSSEDKTSDNDKDFELFLIMDRRIDKQGLFLNPNKTKEEIFAAAGISRRQRYRLLNKFYGAGTNDYLNRKRLKYAVELMRENPRMPKSEVAAKSGFYTFTTFGRNFNKVYGMSPSEYINKLIDENL